MSLSGCGALSAFSIISNWTGMDDMSLVSHIETENIGITAALGANRDTPVALDIVGVSDEKMVQVLVKFDAKSWFLQKDKFVHQSGFNINTFEVVPGQTIPIDVQYSWSDRRKYRAVFVFAKMLAPGLHHLRIDKFSKPIVVIGTNAIRVAEKQN